MDALDHFFAQVSTWLWGWPMIIMLLGTHLFLTIRLRFPQRKIFTAIRLSVTKDKGVAGDVSQFGALATSLAAAAQTRNPVRQALVSSTGTFWDTVVICALTGLVLVSSIIAFPDIDHTQGGALTKAAFGKIPFVGTLILTVGIVTFAFSTILGWSYYAEKAVEYLGGKRWIKVYRVLWIIAIYIGSVMNLSLVWNLADGMNALMAIPNLISLIFLSGVAVKETRKYLWEGNLDKHGK